MSATVEGATLDLPIAEIASSPTARGPFVLTMSGMVSDSVVRRLQGYWQGAFERIGAETPPLIVLSEGATLTSLTDGDLRTAGLMRLSPD